jgi:hypothetical protein
MKAIGSNSQTSIQRAPHHPAGASFVSRRPLSSAASCPAHARYSDHHEFDLTIFKGSLSQNVARHLFDGAPICMKVLLRLYLRWKFGLQNATLPCVPIRYLKRYRLRSLVDLLLAGLGKFPHTLFPYETFALAANEAGRRSDEIGRDSWMVVYGRAD